MSDVELVKEALFDYASKAGESFSIEALLRIEAELEQLRADNEELREELVRLSEELERLQEG